mgnify:CR=1 FL=1
MKCGNNEGITRENGDTLAKFCMNGWFSSALSRIIETGKVVVNQRGAVEQFDGAGRGIGKSNVT